MSAARRLPLAELPDEAVVQLIAADPPLAGPVAGRVVEAVDKLLQQFAREDRLSAWAVETGADGAILIVAWTGEDLSGCSKDKLAQVLTDRERRDGVALLSAPPLVVELREGTRAIDRPTLKRLIAEGAVGPDTHVYDRRISRLGGWRAARRLGLGQSWLRDLLEKPA